MISIIKLILSTLVLNINLSSFDHNKDFNYFI